MMGGEWTDIFSRKGGCVMNFSFLTLYKDSQSMDLKSL